jgi:phosphate starvation-inducible PhoH-like protein
MVFITFCRAKQLYNIKNPKQIKFQEFINDINYPIVFGIGPAGTGKTFITTHQAINALINKKYEKIIITRPAVTVDEELGYLKGDIKEKMQPYIQPIIDYFQDFYSQEQINMLIETNKLEISPIAYLRGRTFKNAFIIADEVQNTTPNQLKMLLTRIGNNSKLVCIGDPEQSDLNKLNGLTDFVNKLNLKYPETYKMYDDGIALVQFDNKCIQRHKIIKTIIDIYEQ